MNVVGAPDVSLIERARRWWRERTGLEEAEASLERTRHMRTQVGPTLDAIARNIRREADRLDKLGRHDLAARYKERMRDRVEP